MIKPNVLRKNLLTNKVDYGEVNTEHEANNRNGKINKDYPYIEILLSEIETLTEDIELAKITKIALLKTLASSQVLVA